MYGIIHYEEKSLIMHQKCYYYYYYFFFTQSSAQGTVPYLGIFLTDLTMLDTAVKDRLDVSHSVPQNYN